MHGRPRQAPAAATQEELVKIQQYNKHKTAALVAYKNRVFSPTTLALTASILALNPDLNTLYNFRKEQCLDLLCKGKSEEGQGEKKNSPEIIYQNELNLSTTSLKKNPKSYHAWYHRIWCLEHGKGYIDIKNELNLTENFLKMDPRNFHCWNYRRYLGRILMGLKSSYCNDNRSNAEIKNELEVIKLIISKYPSLQPQDITILEQFTKPLSSINQTITIENELLFTQKWIENDFSNYSSWHYRSLLLPTIIMRKFIQLPLQSYEFKGDSTKFDNFFGIKLTKLTSPEHKSALNQVILTSERINTALLLMNDLVQLPEHVKVLSIINFTSLYFQYCISIINLYLSFDLSYINIAIGMSPNDQSPWLYQRWILSLIQQFLSGFKIESAPLATATATAAAAATSIIETEDKGEKSRQDHQKTIEEFVSNNFIPNSDHNTHYTELITQYNEPSLITITPKEDPLYPGLVEVLFNGLKTVMDNDESGADGKMMMITPSEFFIRVNKSCQKPLLQLDQQHNQQQQQNNHYTLDSVVARTQKITIGSMVSSISSFITDIIINRQINSQKEEQIQIQTSTTQKQILNSLIQPLKSLQIKLLTQQYQFLSKELLPLVLDQVQSQRQVLLGIVILRLCIGAVLMRHRELVINRCGGSGSDSGDDGHKGEGKEEDEPSSQSDIQAMTLLKSMLMESITVGQSQQQQQQHQDDPALDIVRLLISIDQDRFEYYKELETMLKNISLKWD